MKKNVIKNLMLTAIIVVTLAAVCNVSDKEMLIERSADLELRVNNYFDFNGGDEAAREYFVELLNADTLSHAALDEIEREFSSYKENH